MSPARPLRTITGAAWLQHVQHELAAAGVEIENLASGAVRLCNGGCRITVAEMRYLDPRDLRDLVLGRSN